MLVGVFAGGVTRTHTESDAYDGIAQEEFCHQFVAFLWKHLWLFTHLEVKVYFCYSDHLIRLV